MSGRKNQSTMFKSMLMMLATASFAQAASPYFKVKFSPLDSNGNPVDLLPGPTPSPAYPYQVIPATVGVATKFAATITCDGSDCVHASDKVTLCFDRYNGVNHADEYSANRYKVFGGEGTHGACHTIIYNKFTPAYAIFDIVFNIPSDQQDGTTDVVPNEQYNHDQHLDFTPNLPGLKFQVGPNNVQPPCNLPADIESTPDASGNKVKISYKPCLPNDPITPVGADTYKQICIYASKVAGDPAVNAKSVYITVTVPAAFPPFPPADVGFPADNFQGFGAQYGSGSTRDYQLSGAKDLHQGDAPVLAGKLYYTSSQGSCYTPIIKFTAVNGVVY